jgi:myo-inositol-1(or 4)-monophosphatase
VTSDEIDFEHARRVAVRIAEEAGALLIAGFTAGFTAGCGTGFDTGFDTGASGIHARAKGDFGDVVTDLDLAAEHLILTRLKAAFPGHRIIAEESGVHQAEGGDGRWTWLVDPLDGTNNVAIGMPAFVVGLALCGGGRPVVGVVHDPVTRSTWSAVAGAGAQCPSGPLRPRPRTMPHGPVLGWTQGHAVARTDDVPRALKLALELNCYRLLQLWAPLICWVMLATGQIDGFVGYHAEALDLPAGSILATEAGLSIVSLDGGPFSELGTETARRSFVAGHPEQLERLLNLVRSAEKLRPGIRALSAHALAPLSFP